MKETRRRRPPRWPRPLSRIALNGLKVLAVLIISFLLLEFVLLAFNDRIFSGIFIYNPELGFQIRPHTRWGNVETNEFGFNDADYPLTPAPGMFRIMTLGDSFQWAGGSENYAHQLERLLQDRFGGNRVEVINAGYPSTHTYEQLLLLRSSALRYQPGLVVLGFFASSDFIEGQPWRRRIVVGDAFVDVDTREESWIDLFGQPLILRSRLWLFLQSRWALYQRNRQLAADAAAGRGTLPAESDTESFRLPDLAYKSLEYARMQFFKRERADEYRPHVDFILGALGAMQEELAEAGCDLVVVAFPDHFQVDPELRSQVLEYYRDDPRNYDWERAQRILVEFCHRRGIEVHDLLPDFRSARSMGEPLYLMNDSHWNAAGNTLAADLIARLLAGRIEGRLQPAPPR